MKKIFLLSAAVLSILATASCSKESAGADSVITIIDASIAPSKTALGDKDGSAWPNYWKAGDQIIVNGVTSGALGQEADGNASATFSFSGAISTPYYAAYPAAAVSDYAAGNATITLPASQAYVAGSYDPAAFLMCGTSSDASSVVLTPCVGVFHLSLDGSASINKVKFTAAEDAALSGDFLTDFNADFSPLAVQNTIEMVPDEAVKLPADFFICLPVGLEGALKVEVFDTEGGSMSKNATIKSALVAGQVYAPGTLTYSASYDIEITAEGITSSTAVICWDNSPAAAYTISVYSDAGCSALVDSYAVDAGNSCWRGQSPRFCVSGLAPGTTYYVKVSNTTHGAESNVLPVTTEDFEIVMVSSTPADIDDVLLAEDFGELRWDCDMIGAGAGWFPTEEAQKTSFATVEVSSYQAAATSNEKQLSPQLGPLVLSRLGDWAQGANRNMYIHPGYIKLVGSNNVTHIVTPALDNIPEGMSATLEVEVVASAYYSESSSSFCTKNAVVAVQKQNPDEPFNDLLSNETNTLDLSSNVAPITLAEELAWNTYTVTVTGVFKGDRLAFGAAKNVTKNDARMNISSMKVTLKELNAPGDLTLALESVTSSTAAFSWGHVGMDADYDVSKPYTAALYRDADCANLVVSHNFEAGASCWSGKSPCFSFGGLEPATTYYLRVTNTEDAKVSDVVSATTAPFEVVDATTVENAGVGDVILAEDFSEIGWGPDEFAGAAGFVPSPKNLIAPSGVNPEGIYDKYDGTGNRLFGTGIDLGDSRLSKGWGFHGNSSTYLRDAYLRVGASGGRTHMVTPKLSGIPAGKVATLEVTVTATKYDSGMKIAAFAEKGLTINSTTDTGNAKYKQYTGASFDDGRVFDISTVKSFVTKTVTLEKVDSECQLVIGSLEDNEGKNRFYFKDIVVTIVELSEPGLEASVKAVSSSTAAFTWTYGGDVAADIAKPYTASLYSNAECTDLVVSHKFEAEAGCWSGKRPCFSFGGLAPSTTYWFVVEDTESKKLSEPVSATTEDFTVVDATTVKDAGIGDVILAEDFSEIGWGPDEFAVAAGFVPNPKNLNVPSGVSPSGDFTAYNSTGQRIFGTGIDLGTSRLSKGWGFFGNSAAYLRNAYLRVATTSGRTHIVTPALSGIPEGKNATIEVTVTATKMESNDNDVAVFVGKGLEMDEESDPNSGYYKKYYGSLTDGYPLGITTVKDFETKTVVVTDVDFETQLLIGSYENIDGKNRFCISDVIVTITDLVDDPAMIIKDEATFNEFVSAVAAGDKSLEAKVTSSFEVSAATAEAFASIEDFAGVLNGNGKTISGLTKPLFNDLKGTVKDLTLNSTLNVTVDQLDLGILANVLSGSASGCTSQGSVTFNVAGGVAGEHHIAGLIGMAVSSGATIVNCTNKASVTNETSFASGNSSELMVAGVLGTFWGEEFSISGCENTGTVINNGAWNKDVSVGGVIGQAGNSTDKSCSMTVTGCTNSGAVSNNGANEATNSVGGVIGWIRFGTYTDNSNTGEVSNTGDAKQNRIGGLIGYLDKNAVFDNNSNEGYVSNTGAASDINYVGGLLGRMQTGSTFKNNSNSGAISNSGDAKNYVYMGGIVGYMDKENKILNAGKEAMYKLTNSGNIENGGSAKNICLGGLFGRNSSGYFNMEGTSSKYSSNSGNITDNSGPAKSNGGDLSIGGIAGYTTTGIKTQYARNAGDIYVTGDKGGTSINVGGIGGWISNASFNFNNCRNTGNVTVDATTTASIWVAGIVGCPKNNNTLHYYWYSNAVIDTHAATVGGENYTAGLMGTPEGNFDSGYTVFHMYGHKLAGTVWGSKTTTGLFCCTKSTDYILWVSGGTAHANTIAPGTLRKDNTHNDTVSSIDDITLDIMSGGAGSSAIAITDPDTTETEEAKKPKKVVTLTEALERGQIAVAEW